MSYLPLGQSTAVFLRIVHHKNAIHSFTQLNAALTRSLASEHWLESVSRRINDNNDSNNDNNDNLYFI